MKAIVQRVSSASVSVDNHVISQISKGLLVLVGIGTDDTLADAEYIAKKVVNLRLFDSPEGIMWKSSVKDIRGDILCVSQFTLMANVTKGSKPDFHAAMSTESSRTLYTKFLSTVANVYGDVDHVKDGQFGAMMSVSLMNEGPVTIPIDSRKFEYVKKEDTKQTKTRGKQASTSRAPVSNVETALPDLQNLSTREDNAS